MTKNKITKMNAFNAPTTQISANAIEKKMNTKEMLNQKLGIKDLNGIIVEKPMIGNGKERVGCRDNVHCSTPVKLNGTENVVVKKVNGNNNEITDVVNEKPAVVIADEREMNGIEEEPVANSSQISNISTSPATTTGSNRNCKIVDLQGYVIIVTQTTDNKVKLYGSPDLGSSEEDELEVAHEIMDVNETLLEDMSKVAVICHIHECIQSCLITLRVRRRTDSENLADLGANIVEDAFLIAVEDKARERLQRLSALKRIQPVDMSLLCIEKNAEVQTASETGKEKECSRENSKSSRDSPDGAITEVKEQNGYKSNSNVFVTSISDDARSIESQPTTSSPKALPKICQANSSPVIANGIPPQFRQTITKAIIETHPEKEDIKSSDKVKTVCEISDINNVSEALSVAQEHLSHGCTEKLLGDTTEIRARAAALQENYLGPGEKGSRRRSGSSIVVLAADEDKRPPEDDALNMLTMLSISSDNGPHREMAVDVPDSFIARNKTPPRYPPPRPPQVRQRASKDEEPLLSSSGGSGTSFGSKQSTVLHSAIDLSGPVSSDGSGSFKTQETSTLDLMSGPRSSDGSRTSYGSKKSSKGSSETAKCGDLFSDRSGSVGSHATRINDHIIQLLISNGEESLLDCREGVSYSAKTDSVLIREAVYASYTLPPGFDTTPVLLGREVPVDVPDSFVQVVKTTPKYPSSVDRKSVTSQVLNGNGTAKPSIPAVPPRETPRDAPPRPPTHEPTREQLDSIKKYQQQIRQRKEADERAAAENEFLRTSLRGSAKLQALEASSSPSTAFVNDAYDADDYDDDVQASDNGARSSKIFNITEVAAALGRIQAELGMSEPALAARMAESSGLLQDPALKSVLETRAAIHEASSRPGFSQPYSARASDKLKDCMDALGGHSSHSSSRAESSQIAGELLTLLASLDMENLIHAHDQAASVLDLDCQPHGKRVPKSKPRESNGLTDETPDEESEIKIIRIEKTNEPLGATVRNEGEAVIIGRIVRGGAAEKSGLLHEGDELLEVNGVPMRGKSVHEVCQVLSGLTGTLTLWIAPRPNPVRPTPPQNRVLHVRAHFDYDPEDDVYIPCRELGISFQKGDVLHVIGREDPNWWQAFREGEEDQSLAGLIPSQAFQHQRESMKMTLAGEVAGRDKARKGGTLLCAKKSNKKKKGKKATSEAGYPLYSTSAGEAEYEQEEILTYEEVALYYPRASNKRPIVLIGPPNIGRHELRQRLMEDSSRFAAAVPHTSRPRKDHEMPGQDYHFISRTQFESDILHRKFVEHGEFEKAYYGTSLEAIREVVNSGKICVLNLHPQSLKILRGSDLKPYTVFVAPPSLEKLRQKKIRNEEAFKEEELKEIIATARDMELRWGHLFDMIIINNDTQRAYQQLLIEINSLEREPQWVPANWLKQP